ncbi:MAG: hypothetical protein ACREUG_11400 [Steroidobacteraceae bacterium]
MRRTHHTILLVCEGDAEDQLACFIRDLYLPRNCGTVLHRKNARGYGGARTLELAIGLKGTTAYDEYGVMVDTDQHWGEAERASAQQHGIVPIENHPCLEAMLLQVAGQKTRQLTQENKAAFEARFGSPAHRDGVIARHFTREMFDNARGRIASLGKLLSLIRC